MRNATCARHKLQRFRREWPFCIGTDLETIINWIAHPFDLSELILKPEYL